MTMASGMKSLDREVRIALQYIAQVRNRFCHQSPWFASSEERSRFVKHVGYLANKFQLNMWRGGPVATRLMHQQQVVHENQALQQQQQQQQRGPIPSLLAAPSPAKVLVIPVQGYQVPDNDEEAKRKVEEAQAFAATQRERVMESQRMEEEEEEENMKAGEQRADDEEENEAQYVRFYSQEPEANDDEWICPFCQYSNQIEDILCAICAEGVPPDRWKCPVCTHVNFQSEDACLVCETSKSAAADSNAFVVSSDPHGENKEIIILTSPGPREQSKKRQKVVEFVDEEEEDDDMNGKRPPSSSAAQKMTTAAASSSSSAAAALPPLPPAAAQRKQSSSATSATTTTAHRGSSSSASSSSNGKIGEDDPNLPGWYLEREVKGRRVYRNRVSGVDFEVEWPLPTGWRLEMSSSKPTQRLCFACKGRKQSVYPPKDCPKGWVLVNETDKRRTFQKVDAGSSPTSSSSASAFLYSGDPILFHTPWPLPEGWILAESKSHPNQLCYLRVSDGRKHFKFPKDG